MRQSLENKIGYISAGVFGGDNFGNIYQWVLNFWGYSYVPIDRYGSQENEKCQREYLDLS